MNHHDKKMIAPIVITCIIILYCIVYAIMFFLGAPSIFKIIGGILALAGIGVAIYVLVERINEIRSGEEDDLSKY